MKALVFAGAILFSTPAIADTRAPDHPPTAPGRPAVHVHGPTLLVVSWQRSSDDRGAVAGYEVLRDGISLGIFDALSYVDRNPRSGRDHDYAILAVDNAGQRSRRANVRAVVPDAVPSPPTGVRAEVYSRTAAELFWDRSGVLAERYEIRRDGEIATVTDGTSHFDDTLTGARTHQFEVIALNRQGQRSAPVRLFVDTAGDGPAPTPTRAPVAPAGLRSSVYSATAAEVFWERPMAFGLVHEVRRNGELLATTDGTSWFDDTLEGGTSYAYEIVAIDREGRRSTPSRAMLNTRPGVAPPPREASTISVDNHVALLEHVFDIYTGNAYGPALLALPGYSDIPEGPSGPGPGLGEPFVVTATCTNGGTAAFDRIRWGSFGQTVGWVYDFDGCQDGGDVLDGVMSEADNTSERFVSSPGYTLDRPDGQTRFRGNAARLYRDLRGLGPTRRWYTTPPPSAFTPNAFDPSATGMDFVSRGADGEPTFELLNANTSSVEQLPAGKTMEGRFSIRSAVTGGEPLEVRTLEPLRHDGFAFIEAFGSAAEHPDFETGELEVRARNGDTLVLDADTGDRDTVRIEIRTGGVTATLMQPWSLWRERLEFSTEFLGGL